MKYGVQLREMTARAMGAEALGASAAAAHRKDLRRMKARAEWAEHGKAHAIEAATAAFVGLQQMTARVKEVEQAGTAAAAGLQQMTARVKEVEQAGIAAAVQAGRELRWATSCAEEQEMNLDWYAPSGQHVAKAEEVQRSDGQRGSGAMLLRVSSVERAGYRTWL